VPILSTPAALPALITVTGTVLNAAEAPAAGQVIFAPSTGEFNPDGSPVITSITDISGQAVIDMSGVVLEFDENGQFSAGLIPTDTPGLSPAGWTYAVTFQIPGLADYGFTCLIPASPFPFTATLASPALFTASGSAYASGAPVVLSGTSLPGGFAPGAYYVTSPSAGLFNLAAASGGAAIASTSAGSGTVSTASVDLSQLAQNPSQPVAAMADFLQGTYPGGTSSYLRSDGTWQPFAGADKNYTQAFTAVSTIDVTHNLGKLPAVTVMDTADDEMVGDVVYNGLNALTVTFTAPTSGTVICN
jgi:hypothetical protein